MFRTNLDREAREYLILLGLNLEEWILKQSEQAKTGYADGTKTKITVADLRRALPALCEDGVQQVVAEADRDFLEQQEGLRRAGVS